MSDEIKNETNQSNDETEQSTEIMQKVSLDEDDDNDDEEEENEQPLSTPNGRETPSAISYSEIVVEKHDENQVQNTTDDLLQIISDQSNKDASSAILNTVEHDFNKKKRFYMIIFFLNFSLSMEILISIKIISLKNRANSLNYLIQYLKICLQHYKLNFSVF